MLGGCRGVLPRGAACLLAPDAIRMNTRLPCPCVCSSRKDGSGSLLFRMVAVLRKKTGALFRRSCQTQHGLG